jgi:predicted nucleic acid-binding protein
MILVDTSVWIDHLQKGSPELAQALNRGNVLMHPFVLGELGLGSLRQRAQILDALQNLPFATMATDAEVMGFVSANVLHGIGIGYVDAHLLASARLTPGAMLWTADRRLRAAATRLGLANA